MAFSNSHLWGILVTLLVPASQALSAEMISSNSPGHLKLIHEGVGVGNELIAGTFPFPDSFYHKHRRDIVSHEDGSHTEWNSIAPDAVEVKASYPNSGSVGATFTFAPDDTLYGVWSYPWNGSIANAGQNHADIGTFGTDRPGINWANARAPFFFSRSGFGVYVDSLQVGSFDFSEPGTASFSFNGSELTYNVLYNSNLTELLMRYANLSSKPEMPIDSGYGPIFWSDNFEEDFHQGVSRADENFYDVMKHLKQNQIRATAIFADRPYGTGNWSFGNFDFDPKNYPDPRTFIANLSSQGYDFQAWVANRAFLHTELYNTSMANGWLFPGFDGTQFLGPALNLSIPAAYSYLLERLTSLARIGVKGFKIDRGEEREMPDAEQNLQSILFNELCYKAMETVWGKGNFFSFARSAFDRSRSKVAIWNGDSQANFTGLQYSVASAIRAGLLGFSHWGSDTGGYLRTNSTPTEELWARWMHFSAFSPMYEIMVGTKHTPWYDYSPRLVRVLKDTAALHTSLIPYIRSYAYAASQTGLPVMRALFLEYPGDDKVAETGDAYAFGKEFLVAPIVTQGGNRTVYFPRGQGRFLEYINKSQTFKPGETHEITNMPLEYSPVYVREGAIIPTGDVYQGNAKWVANWKPHLVIEVYPSYNVSVSSFTYYRGKESTPLNGTTSITMTARSGNVTIQSGDLGVDGTILVYHKNGVENITLPSGEEHTLHIGGLVSLFE